jgi:cell division protein ZapA
MNRVEAIIAGRSIPLKVSEEEEVYVRQAIEDINAKIRQYQTEYANKDIQDCILMALLTYGVDYHKVQSRILDEVSVNTLIDIRDHLQILETQTSE